MIKCMINSNMSIYRTIKYLSDKNYNKNKMYLKSKG